MVLFVLWFNCYFQSFQFCMFQREYLLPVFLILVFSVGGVCLCVGFVGLVCFVLWVFFPEGNNCRVLEQVV